MTGAARPAAARGTPLAMMGLVLAAWIGGRALVWESPFPAPATMLGEAFAPFADAAPRAAPATGFVRATRAGVVPGTQPRRPRAGGSDGTIALLGSGAAGMDPALAFAHLTLRRAALRSRLIPAPTLTALAAGRGDADPLFLPATPPAESGRRAGRWSLDAWGFLRQGSDAAPISQGRVPIYGASQVGAMLQYRLAPDSGRDPRLHARAYKALVRRGESELALGASARPLPRVPVRVFGEMRLTDGAFRNEVRPSAYAVTELAPLDLPLGTRLETYAQAGWVGGTDATFFADGQAILTREIAPVARASDNALRLSLGAGAWGGAQESAHRVDVGPTMRLDVTLGEVPARLSLDWRERVEGDAGPDSGVAVTLSTRF